METLRPIISGIIGAIIAAFICRAWAKWIPKTINNKNIQTLNRLYGRKVSFANYLSISGLIAGGSLYFIGNLDDHDWRGVGLGFGLMAFLPIIFLTISTVSQGISGIKEALVTFAINSKSPPIVLYVVMTLMFFVGAASAYSLLTKQ